MIYVGFRRRRESGHIEVEKETRKNQIDKIFKNTFESPLPVLSRFLLATKYCLRRISEAQYSLIYQKYQHQDFGL